MKSADSTEIQAFENSPLFEARATTLLKKQEANDAEIDEWLTRVRANGFLTLKDFAILHGVDQAVVSVWLDKGWLPGTYKAGGVWHFPPELVLTFSRRRKGPRRRFSPEAIRVIREKADTVTLKELANEYDVSESLISRIATRDRYGDVA